MTETLEIANWILQHVGLPGLGSYSEKTDENRLAHQLRDHSLVEYLEKALTAARADERAKVRELERVLDELTMAVTREVNEKGGSGYLLARLTDARAELQRRETRS